ncbi:hypothetical protein [Devosia ginsengisoli]|uniref:hypothetical protein n=1 Tax=Devosia ginsengisoli TaxID=400770 RepID=UPI0026EA66FF|nr:hypothetical protein [Devosia ginsengisoli]MCR6670334.1 hypothetical protein [Devosia ginsengisoli]
MFSGDRNDRPALVVLALLIASIVLVSFMGLYARHEANYQVGCYAPTEVNESGQQQYEPVCPEDHLIFGDGAAQWVMAIFALVATGVSWRALVLIRRTFIETERTAEAAVEANKIARETTTRQLRAYVGVRRVDVVTFGIGQNTRIEAVFVNAGQTPAKRVKLSFLTIGVRSLAGAKFPIGKFRSEDWRVGYIEIGPGETYTAACTGAIPLDEEAKWMFTNKKYFIIVGALLRYEDVFGKRHRLIMRGNLSFFPDGRPFIDASAMNNRSD